MRLVKIITIISHIFFVITISNCAYKQIEFSGKIFARLEKNALPQAIAGAKIILTDQTANLTQTDYSNGDGSYSFEIVESDSDITEHDVLIEITKVGYKKIVVPRTGTIEFINDESFYLEIE